MLSLHVQRNDVIQIRISTDEKAEIQAAAASAGKSASEWLREVALAAARSQKPPKELTYEPLD